MSISPSQYQRRKKNGFASTLPILCSLLLSFSLSPWNQKLPEKSLLGGPVNTENRESGEKLQSKNDTLVWPRQEDNVRRRKTD